MKCRGAMPGQGSGYRRVKKSMVQLDFRSLVLAALMEIGVDDATPILVRQVDWLPVYQFTGLPFYDSGNLALT